MKQQANVKAFAFSVLAVALAAIFFVGCGGDSSDSGDDSAASGGDSGETRNIAFFPFSFDNVYIAAAIDEMKKLDAENDQVEVQMFDGQFDTEKQLGQIRDAIASNKFDGFIIAPVDGVGVIPTIEDAGAAGIKVVCITSPCGPDPTVMDPQVEGQQAFVGVDGAQDGAIMAELLVEICADVDPCEVGFIQGVATNTSDVARLEQLNAGIADHPNIKIVATGEGKFEQAEAYKVSQNFIQANPNINVIATGSDQMTLGAQQAVEEAGLVPGKDVQLIGNTASEEAIALICEKTWFGSPVWLPRSEASESLNAILGAINGEEVGSVDVREGSEVGPVVTQENCGEATGQWTING